MKNLFTIGYEATSIDSFVTTLQSVGIELLVDVRAVAMSRKKGFSKNKLSERLQSEGIDYTHLINLGDPKPGREAARAGNYDEFIKIYSSHLASPLAQESLLVLEDLVENKKTCLLCFERDPNTCHRLLVANKFIKKGFDIINIYGDYPERYVNHPSLFKSINARQSFASL